MKRLATFLVTSVFGLACGAGAVAQSEVRIDINEMVVDASGPFGGETHTGPVALGMHPQTRFAGIGAGGGFVAPPFGLSGLTGQIVLNAGLVTGVDLVLTAADGSIFSTRLVGPGGVRDGATGFVIDGHLSDGQFSGSTFAGVDVSRWSGNQLEGFFVLHAYNPDPSGFSMAASLDLFITPAPGSAILVGMGAFLFGARRRR